MLTRETKRIVYSMLANPVVIENGKRVAIIGMVELMNDSVMPLIDYSVACKLRYCYLDLEDNMIHVTRESVGIFQVAWMKNPDAINMYNKNIAFAGLKIKCIHCADGEIIYPGERNY